MSTVAFDTWTDQAGLRTYAPVTAWANFDGVNLVIRDSLNVSSLTDIQEGVQEINFETPMNNSNYSVNALARISSVATRIYLAPENVANLLTTMRFVTDNRTALLDATFVHVQVVGGV